MCLSDLQGFTLPSGLIDKIKLKTLVIYNELCKKHGCSVRNVNDPVAISGSSGLPLDIGMLTDSEKEGGVR